ncbi:MAG: DUF6777 domain-containing protein [Actinomycetota bacterium]|nr:DUF6777 domain-containing protein [Actinomycetota bacterium]
MTCSQCGREAVTGDVFCRGCGAGLGSQAVPQSAPPPDGASPSAPSDRGRRVLIGSLIAAFVLLAAFGLFLTTRGDSEDVAAGTDGTAATSGDAVQTTTAAIGGDGVSALGPGETSGEIFLEPAGTPGPDSFTGGEVFTEPVVATTAPIVTTTTAPATTLTTLPGQVIVEGRSGDRPGLYGGTRDSARCDAAGMLSFLQAHPAQADAWVEALNSDPAMLWGEDRTSLTAADLPDYFAELTPLTLIEDTRVTNHGFRDGKATPRQSVLQAGTAVLVDRYGVPRAKCACGNPLIPPKPAPTTPTYVGTPWPGWGTTIVVVVQPTVVIIEDFILIDVWDGTFFGRPAGTYGSDDQDGTGVAAAGTSASVFVLGPMAPTGGYAIDAPYDTVTFTVDLDPAALSWIALSGAEAPLDQPAGVGSDRTPDGILDIMFPDVDDLLSIEIAKDGESITVVLHDNDASGTPIGNQAVIYGYHPSVWHVSNIDWSTNPPITSTVTNPETGELTAFFDEYGGAGSYQFTVTYVNLYTDMVAHGDLYLIAGN